MRKIVSLTLLVTAAIGLTACSSQDETANTTTADVTANSADGLDTNLPTDNGNDLTDNAASLSGTGDNTTNGL